MMKMSHTSHRVGSGKHTAQKCRGGSRTAPTGTWILPAGIIYPDHLVAFILCVFVSLREPHPALPNNLTPS